MLKSVLIKEHSLSQTFPQTNNNVKARLKQKSIFLLQHLNLCNLCWSASVDLLRLDYSNRPNTLQWGF